jgi:hypothetical protein
MMTRAVVIIVILAVLLIGIAACAGSLLSGNAPSNTLRTSCVGLINIGSCNITMTTNNNPSNGTLLLFGAFGVGCLILGCLWPSGRNGGQ